MQVIVLVQPQITVIDLVNEHVLGFQSMSIFKKPNCRQKGTGTGNGKGYRIRGYQHSERIPVFSTSKGARLPRKVLHNFSAHEMNSLAFSS